VAAEFDLIFQTESVARVRYVAADPPWVVGELVTLRAGPSLRRKLAMMVSDSLPDFDEDDFDDGFLEDSSWFLRLDDGAVLEISIPAVREAAREVFWQWRDGTERFVERLERLRGD